MQNFSARTVFFVRDTPRAMEFYTRNLGFNLDWKHEEQGRPYVVQVSLFGLQIILNQSEDPESDRPGHPRPRPERAKSLIRLPTTSPLHYFHGRSPSE